MCVCERACSASCCDNMWQQPSPEAAALRWDSSCQPQRTPRPCWDMSGCTAWRLWNLSRWCLEDLGMAWKDMKRLKPDLDTIWHHHINVSGSHTFSNIMSGHVRCQNSFHWFQHIPHPRPGTSAVATSRSSKTCINSACCVAVATFTSVARAFHC